MTELQKAMWVLRLNATLASLDRVDRELRELRDEVRKDLSEAQQRFEKLSREAK